MAKKKNSVTVKRKAKSTRRTRSIQELEPGVMDRMRRVAVHEAGHAVAHIRLGIDQEYASIEPGPGTAGRVSAEGVKHVWNAEAAQPMAVAYCAGYAAEVASGYDEITAAGHAEGGL